MRIHNPSLNRASKWIREQLAAHTLGEREQAVIAFSLVHIEGGVSEREVKTLKIGGPVNELELAKVFLETATDYASEIANVGSGMQQFMLFAHAEGVTGPVSSYPMKVAGDVSMGLTGTEPNTQAGLLGQMMRHNEALIQTTLASIGRMNEQLLNANARMMDNQENLTARHFETIQLAETVIMQAAEGEHAKKLELMKLERSNSERNKLLTMAPGLANMLAGEEIFPQSSADTSILESIAHDMTSDDLRMLMVILESKVKNKEILGVLFDRLGKIIDARSTSNGASDESTHST